MHHNTCIFIYVIYIQDCNKNCIHCNPLHMEGVLFSLWTLTADLAHSLDYTHPIGLRIQSSSLAWYIPPPVICPLLTSSALSPVTHNISGLPTSLNYLQLFNFARPFFRSTTLHMLFPVSGMPSFSLLHVNTWWTPNRFLKLSSCHLWEAFADCSMGHEALSQCMEHRVHTSIMVNVYLHICWAELIYDHFWPKRDAISSGST